MPTRRRDLPLVEDDSQEPHQDEIDPPVLKQAMNTARGQFVRDQPRHSSPHTTPALRANISKRRAPGSGSSHVSWRIGMAPSTVMTLSKEESQIEQILSQTSAFYCGMFETSWSRRLQESSTAFDIMSEMENFSGSITTAGGLLAVDRIDTASLILGRVLPTLQHLLVSQHPQLYYVLADLSLDTSDNELGRLRGQVKRFSAGISQTILGAQHPITRLLRLDLPLDQTLRLRELIQRKVHELHEQFFSQTSYQTTGQYYYLARVLAQLGQTDEAARILSSIMTIWEVNYGMNSLMSVTALLEMTKVRLAQNNPDVQAECLVNDALQRTLTLEDSTKVRPLSAGIVHSRMGCLRTLARLFVMRNNYTIALQHYTQAVQVGINELGPAAPAVLLALADLDAASKMAAHANANAASIGLEE
ncbi:uncharacterized protein Z518_02742 [Rhinocladiella mackenziei CBS 650.93]|uniref:Uncharacterized protein n=1 Tax=Rhinocladiella mackenziei CBS 650.93 TaxID=1442369 RepID=A0A0D2G0Q6_9EURO|nr:uncharacterized protein Z518_02742 [Rhinocladiella mackenziei CBS 650.93]KIX08087.1 hypothetical protein Z518_02742 [Rhinocladiella mackenziei CBS 650.93]